MAQYASVVTYYKMVDGGLIEQGNNLPSHATNITPFEWDENGKISACYYF